ncbi:hypothetical protein NQ317_014346 [Molorchus minor]|uniref:Uncharacterized protein n=1 Tax=Molorchus minor TaxID=1323400 RepID=A0ABQ9K6Q7_9CUCU|nr:hypothetical protein NQ317_014346 [Molorchus minor]
MVPEYQSSLSVRCDLFVLDGLQLAVAAVILPLVGGQMGGRYVPATFEVIKELVHTNEMDFLLQGNIARNKTTAPHNPVEMAPNAPLSATPTSAPVLRVSQAPPVRTTRTNASRSRAGTASATTPTEATLTVTRPRQTYAEAEQHEITLFVTIRKYMRSPVSLTRVRVLARAEFSFELTVQKVVLIADAREDTDELAFCLQWSRYV